jgi:hypothetical protein
MAKDITVGAFHACLKMRSKTQVYQLKLKIKQGEITQATSYIYIYILYYDEEPPQGRVTSCTHPCQVNFEPHVKRPLHTDRVT